MIATQLNVTPIGAYCADVGTWDPTTHPTETFTYIDIANVKNTIGRLFCNAAGYLGERFRGAYSHRGWNTGPPLDGLSDRNSVIHKRL